MKNGLILIALAALPIACGGSTPEENGAGDAAAAAAGKALFASYGCVACHGEMGKGDGPASVALNPKPRDYTNAAWQAETNDGLIKKVILEGGLAAGLSAAMPGHKLQIGDKTDDLNNIVAYIRSLSGK